MLVPAAQVLATPPRTRPAASHARGVPVGPAPDARALLLPLVSLPLTAVVRRGREHRRERGELTMQQRSTRERGRGEGERSVERIRLWEGERSTREDLAVFGFGYEPSVYVFREKNLHA